MSYTYTPTVNTKGYYQFEDNANDSSGNSNNGTATSVTYTNSIHSGFSKAGSFNGSSSKIDMGNVTAMNFGTASFTISSWIKLSALGTEQGIVNKVDTADNNGFSLYIDDTNKIGWFDVVSGNYADPGLSNITLTTGVRYNIIFVRNASGTYQTYVNGILDKQTTWLTPRNISNTNPLQIGTLRTNSKYFNGLIDEVIIEDIARTAQQVLDRYNQSQKKYLGEYLGAGSGVTKGLYHLNGNANDESGNGNHGTATNVTWVDGKFGQCGSFSPGSNSRVIMPATGITGTSTFTALARFNTSNTGAGKFILAEWEYGGRLIKVTSTNVLETAVNTTGFTANTTTNTVTDGAWHLASLTYDGSNQKTYLDGVLVKSTSQTGNVANYQPGTGSNIGINNTTFGWQEQFNGLIDEVIIENRAWTALEIQKHYTYTKGRFGIM